MVPQQDRAARAGVSRSTIRRCLMHMKVRGYKLSRTIELSDKGQGAACVVFQEEMLDMARHDPDFFIKILLV